jgi:hypothetical protein
MGESWPKGACVVRSICTSSSVQLIFSMITYGMPSLTVLSSKPMRCGWLSERRNSSSRW